MAIQRLQATRVVSVLDVSFSSRIIRPDIIDVDYMRWLLTSAMYCFEYLLGKAP
jgi:hypothetical protein